MSKNFRIAKGQFKSLATGYGGCIASDMITVGGYLVRWMYREIPDFDTDSGWRFFSGYEDDEYTQNASNHEIYDVNTIANYDPSIIPHLNAAVGSAFEKPSESERFLPVTDWVADGPN